MGIFLLLVGMGAVLYNLVKAFIRALKKKDVKKNIYGFIAGIVLFSIGISALPEPKPVATEKKVEAKKEVAPKKEVAEKPVESQIEKNETAFNTRMDKMIQDGGGVIISIQPTNGDYQHMKMVVSDDWFVSPEHIQQRFADQAHETLLVSTRANGMIEMEDEMWLTIEDAYGSKLADYSVWSGMKLKK